ncbi:hypothetical protein DOM22_13770 [Bdellovibrio sp. ZAP7]|nr:hypothetical protein DOM22_13770 [Bdellovibrio sp. ZAP7]
MMNTSLMGTGYWGGNQNCAYQQRPAQAAVESDEVQEAKETISELKQEISEKKSEKKKYDREAERSKSDIKKNISEDYADFMIAHMESARRCSEYVNFNSSDDGSEISDEGSVRAPQSASSSRQRPAPPPEGFDGSEPPSDFKAGGEIAGSRKSSPAVAHGGNSNMLEVQAFSLQEWQSYCDARSNGAVFTAVCDNAKFRADSSRGAASSCKSAISSLRTNAQKSARLQGDIESLTRKLEMAQEDLKEARQNSNAEGSVCIECMAKSNSYNYQDTSSNTANLVSNVVLGAGAMYAGYKTNQMVTENNANLGYPTQTPSVMSYGYPYIAQGLYGMMNNNSSGQGGFGCGGQMTGGMTGMNGMYGMMGSSGSNVFGYPSSMNGMTGMSGGIYMGMGSPFGNSGYGSSMYGMNGMNGMMGMNGMYGAGNSMYGMNGMNSMNPYAMNGVNSMYGMNGMNGSMYGNTMNPYSMYGMSGYGANGLNTMYGANAYGMNSQYASMYALQQQIAQMNYNLSAMQSATGVYSGYGAGSNSFISPIGLTNTTTLPGGVITGSNYGTTYGTSYSLPSSYLNTSLSGYNYGNVYTSPYATTSTTIPGVVPILGSTTTSTGSVISGTGR